MGRDEKSVKTDESGEVLLTPKELADAIGASESSLRRWVDRGRLPVSRTAGGHRRIPLATAIRFIRETGATVVRPELLGFDEVPATRRGTRPAGGGGKSSGVAAVGGLEEAEGDSAAA